MIRLGDLTKITSYNIILQKSTMLILKEDKVFVNIIISS